MLGWMDMSGDWMVMAHGFVNAGYDKQRGILHDVDFSIPAGKTVAVVGTTGAGKSTLSRLLYRFYDVNGGRILVDGVDIRAVAPAELRQRFAYVEQEPVIFAGTGERITLSHSAEDRSIFAHGALTAARWGHGKKPGLYSMTDVLGL